MYDDVRSFVSRLTEDELVYLFYRKHLQKKHLQNDGIQNFALKSRVLLTKFSA